jgi:hypothetical protein
MCLSGAIATLVQRPAAAFIRDELQERFEALFPGGETKIFKERLGSFLAEDSHKIGANSGGDPGAFGSDFFVERLTLAFEFLNGRQSRDRFPSVRDRRPRSDRLLACSLIACNADRSATP